jgi:hypothetical protein
MRFPPGHLNVWVWQKLVSEVINSRKARRTGFIQVQVFVLKLQLVITD